MTEHSLIDRRGFLRCAVLVPAAAVAAPSVLTWSASRAGAAEALPFVDAYKTNLVTNTTADANAAVRILSGMAQVWRTGTTWNDGLPVRPEVLHDNVRYCVKITRRRTSEQAKQAFLFDRQHQSYSATGGLGPLADLYRSGAKAVTSITVAPDGTPPTTIDDAVPAGAPAGSAIGAGSTASDLGTVVQFINTVRGPYSSGNPAKFAYQYPRPWRLTDDSVIVDTGKVDAYGYPIYDSDVLVAPQLLRQRS